MAPRSYEFTCKCCGKTVVEASDGEVCAACVMAPPVAPADRAAAPPPPPAAKKPPKKSGFTVTIRTGPKGGPKK